MDLLIGDHLVVNKMVFAPTLTPFERAILPDRPIHHADIIVFKYPQDPDCDLIKRVIGLPGDRVEVHRKKVYVKWQSLVERYAEFLEPPSIGGAPKVDDLREEDGPVTVPTDQYFMLAKFLLVLPGGGSRNDLESTVPKTTDPIFPGSAVICRHAAEACRNELKW